MDGLATLLPNTQLSNGLQRDVILPMLALPSTPMSFDEHGVPLWPQTGRRAGLVYRTRCRLGHCNHSSVRPAPCAGLLEGDAGPNMSLATGCESRDSLLRRGAGSPSSSFRTMVRLHDTALAVLGGYCPATDGVRQCKERRPLCSQDRYND